MKDKLSLVRPSLSYLEQIEAFRQEFDHINETMHGSIGLLDFKDTTEWLDFVKKCEEGFNTIMFKVPSSTFLCIRQSDQKMVDICNIRHNVVQERLFNRVGHIGYSIAPSERYKGYAKEQLRLAVIEAKKIGIDRILMTCDITNIASEKTILANNGIYNNTFHDRSDDSYTKRFWIEVTKND